LSSPAVSLAAVNLKRSLNNQVAEGRFGGADPLKELAIYARESKVVLSGGRYVIAFVLEQALLRWADYVQDRQIQLSEAASLRAVFLEPISNAIACICDNTGDPVVIAEELIRSASGAFR